MTVFYDRRQQAWIYDFQIAGTRHNRRCRMPDGTPAASRSQARACEEIARVAARLDAKGALPRAGSYTLAQAVAARAAEAQHLKHWRDVRLALAEIVEFFGAATPIGEVARRWMEYRSWARARTIRIWRGGPDKGEVAADRPRAGREGLWRDTGKPRSAARTNRYLDQLSALLRLAHETRGPDGRPMLDAMPRIAKLDELTHDPNPVPLSVLARLESDPATPDHLWQAAALVRLFGFRLDEVFGATVDEVDLEERGYRLPAARAKSGKDEFLPANDEAIQLLRWLVLFARERGDRHLVVYRPRGLDKRKRPFAPRPIRNARRAWATALRRIGLEGRYRFHDLRATFITQVAHVASGAAVQDLARHESPSTTARYVKITDKAKRAAVDRMAGTRRTEAAEMQPQSPDAQSRSAKLRRVK